MINAVSTHRIEIVIRTVWVRLPDISPDFVQQLRILYTHAIHHSLIRFYVENASTREIYAKLRRHQGYSKLSAKMIDRAVREAKLWYNQRKRERVLVNSTLQHWAKWGRKQNIPFPDVLSGLPRLISYSEYLKGKPGSRHGQWPQTHSAGARFYIDNTTNSLTVSIDKVAIKTRAIIGGEPEQVLRAAITGEKGFKLGSSRLIIRENLVYLAVPVRTQVKIPQISNLSIPTIIGVDLGINTLAAAVGLSFDGKIQPVKIVSGKRLKHQLSTLWGKRRINSQNQAEKRVRIIDAKINRVINHWVNVAAKCVIKYAKRFQEPIIAIEDLRTFTPSRRRTPWIKTQQRDQLSKWARGKISQAIIYKGMLHGIPVIRVNPAYSSQVCPKGCLCFLNSPAYKKKQRYFHVFVCPACGTKVPRDTNAAIEIARRGKELVQCRLGVYETTMSLGNRDTLSATSRRQESGGQEKVPTLETH